MVGQQAASRFSIDDAAKILDVQPSRFRSGWRQSGIVQPVRTHGLYHVTREDVMRGAVLMALQQVIGIQNPLAVELAKQCSVEDLETLFSTDDPRITVRGPRPLLIGLDPDWLTYVREGLEGVRS